MDKQVFLKKSNGTYDEYINVSFLTGFEAISANDVVVYNSAILGGTITSTKAAYGSLHTFTNTGNAVAMAAEFAELMRDAVTLYARDVTGTRCVIDLDGMSQTFPYLAGATFATTLQLEA